MSTLATLTFLTPVNWIELSISDQLFARTVRGVRIWQLIGHNVKTKETEDEHELAPCVCENTAPEF